MSTHFEQYASELASVQAITLLLPEQQGDRQGLRPVDIGHYIEGLGMVVEDEGKYAEKAQTVMDKLVSVTEEFSAAVEMVRQIFNSSNAEPVEEDQSESSILQTPR